MVLRLACAHLNHAACNLHGLVANPGCDKRRPPVSSQNSTDSPIYGGTRLSRPQSRWFCKCLCMVKRGRIVRSTSLPRPLLCRPKGVSVCSVVKNTLPSGHHVDETARKPTSKPLSVPPCLRPLRVNRPEANRTPRAEGGAGTSRAKHTLPTRSYTQIHSISEKRRLYMAEICNHTTLASSPPPPPVRQAYGQTDHYGIVGASTPFGHDGTGQGVPLCPNFYRSESSARL